MTRDEWVVLPLKDSDEVSIVIRRSEVVAYGPTNGGFTWVTMAGSDNTYTAHMPLAEFEALLFAPATPAPDETYRDAAVRLAEEHARLYDAESRLGVSVDGDFGDVDERRNEVSWAGHARDQAEAAFLRLYRERHGTTEAAHG